MPLALPMDYRVIRSAVHRARFDILSDCRSFETQAKYRAFRVGPSAWASTEDRLKHTLFGAPVEATSDGPARSGAIPARAPAVLVPNDFPYYTTADVEHLVLWAPFALTREFVTAFLDAQLAADAEVAFFVNPPQNKTVPGIEHCHVFVRRQGPRQVVGASNVDSASDDEATAESTADSDLGDAPWRVYEEPTLRGVRTR